MSSQIAAFDAAKLDSLQGAQDLLDIGSQRERCCSNCSPVQDPHWRAWQADWQKESCLRSCWPAIFAVDIRPCSRRVALLTLIGSRETARSSNRL